MDGLVIEEVDDVDVVEGRHAHQGLWLYITVLADVGDDALQILHLAGIQRGAIEEE